MARCAVNGALRTALPAPGLRAGALALLTWASTLGCAGDLAEIPRGEHPLSGGAQPMAVDSAPPPALIDNVSPKPSPDCSWADGQWLWVNNRWQWHPGDWVRVPEGCYYADSLMVWVPTQTGKGILFYTQGQWYQRGGGPCSVPPTCSIQPRKSDTKRD